MHDRLVSRRIDALHQCFLVFEQGRLLKILPRVLSVDT